MISSSDDEWNPEPQETISNQVVVKFTDQIIKRQKQETQDQPYDPQHIIRVAENHKSDEEDDIDDEEMEEGQKKILRDRQIMEQVYFNPLQDDENERWIEKSMNPSGNIVLSCPQCFLQLCYDFQKHEEYNNQYRAMFVKNCKTDQQKVVRTDTSKNQLDILLPVHCAQCGTQVAVFEVQTKLYHFFDVITGYG